MLDWLLDDDFDSPLDYLVWDYAGHQSVTGGRSHGRGVEQRREHPPYRSNL
jgi:hypothetical protein